MEQFYPRAPLVAIEDSTVDDLYVELVATFDLKHHTCSDLTVEEVIYAVHIDENGDGLLFKKSSNFHSLRVQVAGQRVHYVVGRLGLFLYGFIFGFEPFFRWFCWETSADASHVEIVYPCIPDSDGDDEGGQASSSLVVPTRWISAAELLQSDLTTLAQREGGE
ncbi:hypothetical protein BHM03_00052267 [Ensete ventricosum]|nr:hypothetical protein BHM03_00052267 [Ensete ventricosum]